MGKPEKFQGYCTDVWFDQAIQFIRANKDRPFFCYLPTNVPHGPLLVPEKYVQPFAGKVPDSMARFYGMLVNFDENLARLRQELRQLGLEENTIFIFLTDNGTEDGAQFDEHGYATAGFNAGMRGAKISEYEGGHRVPCFVYWPAGGIRGGRDVDRLAAHFDLLPTLIDLCGLTPPPHVKIRRRQPGAAVAKPRQGGRGLARPHAVRPQSTGDRPRQGKELRGDDRPLAVGQRPRALRDQVRSRPASQRGRPASPGGGRAAEGLREWWDDISTDFGKPARIVIGSDRANPTALNPHDWIGRPLFDQSQVRRGRIGRDGAGIPGALDDRSRAGRTLRDRVSPLAAGVEPADHRRHRRRHGPACHASETEDRRS